MRCPVCQEKTAWLGALTRSRWNRHRCSACGIGLANRPWIPWASTSIAGVGAAAVAVSYFSLSLLGIAVFVLVAYFLKWISAAILLHLTRGWIAIEANDRETEQPPAS